MRIEQLLTHQKEWIRTAAKYLSTKEIVYLEVKDNSWLIAHFQEKKQEFELYIHFTWANTWRIVLRNISRYRNNVTREVPSQNELNQEIKQLFENELDEIFNS